MTHMPMSAASDLVCAADELRAGDLVLIDDDVSAMVADASAVRLAGREVIAASLVDTRADIQRDHIFERHDLLCVVAR